MSWTETIEDEVRKGNAGEGLRTFLAFSDAADVTDTDALRDAARDDVTSGGDVTFDQWFAVETIALVDDAETAAQESPTGQAVSFAEQSIDDAGDFFDDVTNSLLPWWLPFAVAGGGVLALLIVLRPYASIGAAALG